METHRLVEVLKRRKWIVIQAVILVMAVTIAVTSSLPNMYETQAVVLAERPDIDTSLLRRMGMKDVGDLAGLPQPVDMETRVDLVTLQPILQQVVTKLQVRDNSGQLVSPKSLTASGPVSALMGAVRGLPRIDVQQSGHANIIQITARSADPDEAAYLANTLAEVFIDENLSKRGRETGAARQFVARQLDDVRDQYHAVLARLADFQRQHGTVNLETESRVGIEKLADLMLRKDEVVSDLAQSRAKLAVIKKQLERESGSDIPTALLRENPQLEALKKRVSDLKQDLASCLTEKTEAHPDCLAISRQLKEAEADLAREVAVAKNSFPELDELQRQVKANEAHLVAINRDIDHYAALLKKIPEKSRDEQKLRLALESARSLYSSLLDYNNQLGVVEAMALSDIRLVQSAPRPDESHPASPNAMLNTMLGALTALGLGLGLAFLREYTDDTIKGPEDLERHGLALLGAVPRNRLHTLIAGVDANDPMNEAYRRVRSGLQFADLDRPLQKLLVTSGSPDEGRTTVAANLAISYGRAGYRTALVDADLRRPRVHRLFSLDNDRGLTSILTGECRVDEGIVPSGLQNLSVLPSGPVPPDPGGVLESERMARLLEVLGRRFEIIVLDSAPMLIKSDAALLIPQVDAMACVVAANQTTRHAVEAVKEVFRKAGVRPAGAVINKLKTHWRLRPRTRLALWVITVVGLLAFAALLLLHPELFSGGG